MDSSEANKELYNSNYGLLTYSGVYIYPAEVSILIDYKDSYKDKRVLDIGCGAGRTTYYIEKYTEEYLGIDYSEKMINYCKEAYPKARFVVKDARDLSGLVCDAYDFVLFSYNGIDYVSHEDRMKILSEIYRVVSSSGLFVFSTHNRGFKAVNRKVSFNFSFHPFRLLYNLKIYMLACLNKAKFSKLENFTDEYALINDSGSNFGMLTYYIEMGAQVGQLKDAGFEVVAIYNKDGVRINREAMDEDSEWIYYVAKKIQD